MRVVYQEIDIIEFEKQMRESASESPIKVSVVIHSLKILIYVQQLITSQNYKEAEQISIKELKEIAHCYPKAIQTVQSFQENQDQSLPDAWKYQLPEVWSVKELDTAINGVCNQIKSIYLMLYRQLLEIIYGKERIYPIRHLLRVESTFDEIANKNQEEHEKVPPVTDTPLDATSMENEERVSKATVETSSFSRQLNYTKEILNEQQAPVYTREDLWLDELLKKKIPLENIFHTIIHPNRSQKIKLYLGRFPFKDQHFMMVRDLLKDSPSIKTCVLLFELIETLSSQKSNENSPPFQSKLRELEETFNDSVHIANLQKICYVHILVKESLESFQKNQFLQCLQSQYVRYPWWVRTTQRAYRQLINKYRTLIKHSEREVARLDTFLQFMFQASRANEKTEDVDLAEAFKNLPI